LNGSVTDEQGNFIFSISNWNDTLIVSYLGYETSYTPIRNIDSDLIIRLKSKSVILSEITVLDDGGLCDIIQKCRKILTIIYIRPYK
jgi:hypothetical protein